MRAVRTSRNDPGPSSSERVDSEGSGPVGPTLETGDTETSFYLCRINQRETPGHRGLLRVVSYEELQP